MASVDHELLKQAEAAWEIAWSRFFCAKTGLFYDFISSKDPAHSQDHLPTVEEVQRQYPNTCGWKTGMEDSAINAGVWMVTICDRYDATHDAAMKAYADRVWQGMDLLASVSCEPGFLPRSVCVDDGKSHYIESSRDQYTHFCHGLWRFYHSPLSNAQQKSRAQQIIADICTRLESKVVAANDYSLCREDGAPGTVDKMWNVWCHEWARLPMIYMIGFDLTAETRWLELYRKYAWHAVREAMNSPVTFRCSWGLIQAVVSMEPLALCEQDDAALRDAWRRAMDFYASRMEGLTWHCLAYKPLVLADFNMDWRQWETETRPSGHVVPTMPDGLIIDARTGLRVGDHAALREPGEALLAQLTVPERTLPEHQCELLKHVLFQTDFDACITFGLFYPIAAYWRAVKQGILHLP